MTPDRLLDRPSEPLDPPADLSLVFRHPQGLLAARAIARSLITQAQRAAQTTDSRQPPAISPSGPGSLSTPDMDLSSASMLSTLLAFTEPQPPTPGEGPSVPQHPTQDGRDEGPEMPDNSHVQVSSSAAPPHAHHSDPFSNAGGSHRSQPHSGPYLPAPISTLPDSRSQTRPPGPPGPTTSSNSLAPLHPGGSAASAQHSSASNMWVNHEFPKTTLHSGNQSRTSSPQPGFFELRQSTFTSLVASQSAMEPTASKPTSKKRKFVSGEDKNPKARKRSKPKDEKKESVFDDSIYMRILEFTPPSFLSKARLISRSFRDYVDKFTSIYVNCRKENFGFDMPPPPKHLTDQQYNELLGGKKGCVAEGCTDRRAIRTHWSWYKRWCWECWKQRIEREDRVMKSRGVLYGRATITKMLECIPVGMHDSFMKPHDYIDNIETRARGAPRLYKYYLIEDIDRIVKEFEDLAPAPYVENPDHSAAERAAALAHHQELMDGLEAKRAAFFAERKAKNDEHMSQVQKIEAGIRMRRARNRNPYDGNRNARKELFSRRAREDLPHIDPDFVRNTIAYKAATRIFRDPGTERGWLTLKPKIEAEWEASRARGDADGTGHMDISDIDANGVDGTGHGLPTRMGHPNESERRSSSNPYARLQHYQSQLQRLEENKHTRRGFPPHSVPGPIDVNYTPGLPSSQSLFSSAGSSSTFTGSPFGAVPMSGRRTASSGGGQLASSSQSLSSGHHLAPPQYFPQSTPLNASSSFAHGSLHNPSTQITVNSLLGPSTPTMPRARSPPQFGPSI